MSKVILVARILLGLAFLLFGMNGFLHFLPTPPPTGAAGALVTALAASGYLFPLMSAFEVIAAVLLLSGRAVPLALTLLAPILVNILAIHVVLDPGGIGPGAVLTVIEIFLAWSYRDAFRSLLSARTPAAAS
jgi:hypothetical protein